MASRLRKKVQGWGARVRHGEKLTLDEWIHLDVPHEQESVAKDRLARLQAMAKRLSELGQHATARAYLDEAGATRSERGFRAIEQTVEELAPAGSIQRAPRTFRQVVQDLCDGTLHDLYPDDIKYRTKQGREARRTQLSAFLPVLGDKTFDAITREDINDAKRLIPKVGQNTRVRYIRELRNVMEIAVDPLELCERTPRVKVPQGTDTREFQLIYPDEEARLAGCIVRVSFEERFLHAFMARNGGRITETLQYTWSAIDLERGKIRVAAAWTKTGKGRFWDLEPDVLEALRLRRLQIHDSAIVFVPPPERKFTRVTVYQHFHQNLRAAGVDRDELFNPPEGERGVTLHDWRGSFVTLARNIGMSDRWIRDRSGHESADVLEKYDRWKRHAAEQGLGWWEPMAIALGMKGAKVASRLGDGSGPKLGQSWAKGQQMPTNAGVDTNRVVLSEGPSRPVNPENLAAQNPSIAGNGGLGPAGFSLSGQSLERLLDLARGAKDWDLVAQLTEQLRSLPTPDNVIPLKGRPR